MGRTENNKIALAAPRPVHFSIAGVDGMENVKDGKDFTEAMVASLGNAQSAFVDPERGRAFTLRRRRDGLDAPEQS